MTSAAAPVSSSVDLALRSKFAAYLNVCDTTDCGQLTESIGVDFERHNAGVVTPASKFCAKTAKANAKGLGIRPCCQFYTSNEPVAITTQDHFLCLRTKFARIHHDC